MSDFIDFIADKANDQVVGKELIDLLIDGTDKNTLQQWFKNKGYDVSLQDCQALIEKKDNFKDFSDNVINNNVKY